MKVNEFFSLFWLNLKVLKTNFVEYCKVVVRYYPHINFAKTDLALLSKYILRNPFKVSKEFLEQKGESVVYAYGETPLTSFDLIVKKAGLKSTDTLYELGCGRGRCCFWLNAFVGCRVIGIDFVPEFIAKAQDTLQQRHLEGIEFRLEDFLQSDLKGATAIYLYGSCYEEPFLRQLSKKLAQLPKGTLIITVSYPLTEYASSGQFEIMNHFSAPFTWGEGDVYLQRVSEK